jgi:hypothetical protein
VLYTILTNGTRIDREWAVLFKQPSSLIDRPLRIMAELLRRGRTADKVLFASCSRTSAVSARGQ